MTTLKVFFSTVDIKSLSAHLLSRPASMSPDNVKDASYYRHSNPTSEAYGFALYIFALVVWVIWIFWAASPEWLLIMMGIEWFPHRYAKTRVCF